MRLLLVNPRFPESFWSFKWAMETVLPRRKAVNPPLGLATLAALCPPSWKVSIVDENIESLPLQPEVDIVGICGMGVQFRRQKELLAFYRSKGYYVVAGGSYASLCPEQYAGLADTVVAGEAEYIWPQFCLDFEAGRPKALYQETGTVSLADSPVPRFDLLDVSRYQSMSLQFSRGCPFRCEFCDIIVMFGRKPRTKSLEQVERELDALRLLGARNVFFVDDNLIGNKRLAKELLYFLRDYQERHGYRFQFGTEASLNLAHDKELLEAFRAAGMSWVFIGIESPDEASLREAQKMQNTHQDILASVRTVYSHGMDIFAGFIVGFDNDTVATFDRQYRFILNSGIQAAMIGLLTAAPKTPLYERLQREGRVIPDANASDNTKLGTNVIPKGMTYDEMVSGFRDLYQRLFDDRGIAQRITNKLRYLRDPVSSHRYGVREALPILRRFVRYGLLPGGARRIWHFVRSVPWLWPRLVQVAVEDWIVGLAMRDYIERHFRPALAASSSLERWLARLESALRRFRERGSVRISLAGGATSQLVLAVRARAISDGAIFRRAARHLEQVLRRTTSEVTLRLEELHDAHVPELERLLRRLARYGDRIRIVLDEQLRSRVQVDSSVFYLTLAVEG
ncbi:MAG TPA: radical SAM protein [Gemmatimonadaceae bacterium]|nr:radical SAM protein [Gemmatimonadaceae bacterium]